MELDIDLHQSVHLSGTVKGGEEIGIALAVEGILREVRGVIGCQEGVADAGDLALAEPEAEPVDIIAGLVIADDILFQDHQVDIIGRGQLFGRREISHRDDGRVLGQGIGKVF